MNYDRFSVEALIADEYFIKWVKAPDEASDRFWKEQLRLFPEQAETIEQARKAVLLLSGIDTESLPEARVKNLKKRIDTKIASGEMLKIITLKERQTPRETVKSRGILRRAYRYAAVLAGILLISAGVYFFHQFSTHQTSYATAYGETKTLTLPDGSKVILSANSALTYRNDWHDSEVREVWLNGEAFFAVKPATGPRKFIVYTADLNVEVLGTKFNVNNREGNTRVVLSSGRIKLNVPLLKDTTSILMKPGELVEFRQKDHRITRQAVDAERYISWINNEWVFENTPLQEITGTLENYYGITIILLDEELAGRTVTTTLPADDPDFILRALSETLNIKITERDENIHIIKNNEPEIP